MALEQLYNLDVAAELIPFPTKAALCAFLGKHKELFPGRYRTTKAHIYAPKVEQRFLTESEILKIREMTLHSFEESRYSKGGPRGPRPKIGADVKIKSGSPLASVLRRAYA